MSSADSAQSASRELDKNRNDRLSRTIVSIMQNHDIITDIYIYRYMFLLPKPRNWVESTVINVCAVKNTLQLHENVVQNYIAIERVNFNRNIYYLIQQPLLKWL